MRIRRRGLRTLKCCLSRPILSGHIQMVDNTSMVFFLPDIQYLPLFSIIPSHTRYNALIRIRIELGLYTAEDIFHYCTDYTLNYPRE